MNRTISVQYCDDIRQELGNKYSLMGCYNGELLLPSFPLTLIKLCVHIKVETPKSTPFEALVIKVKRDEEELQVINFSGLDLIKHQQPMLSDANVTVITFVAGLEMAGISFQNPCTLTVTAETEADALEGAKLKIGYLPVGNIAGTQILAT